MHRPGAARLNMACPKQPGFETGHRSVNENAPPAVKLTRRRV
jgi:hypothetical protein